MLAGKWYPSAATIVNANVIPLVVFSKSKSDVTFFMPFTNAYTVISIALLSGLSKKPTPCARTVNV